MKMKDRIETLEAALQRIDDWAHAYPVDIFHKPSKEDYKKANEVLKANGLSLDAISADTMRHVLEGVADITEKALKTIK